MSDRVSSLWRNHPTTSDTRLGGSHDRLCVEAKTP
jgi:hypothetical protein